MDWISDMVWLAGEWFLLLALSALVGLAIGWFAWRRNAEVAQPLASRPETPATASRPAGNMYLVKDPQEAQVEAADEVVEQDVIDLRALTSERDSLRTQRDRLRSQLNEIEAMVGDEESRRQPRDPHEG